MFEAIDVFMTEVRTGRRVEPNKSLITRIGILSIQGALLEAIDVMITFRCLQSVAFNENDICKPLHRHWKELSGTLGTSLIQAKWTVDSAKWREMESGGKQTWKRVKGESRRRKRGSFALSP